MIENAHYPGQIRDEWFFDKQGNRIKDYFPVGMEGQREFIDKFNREKEKEFKKPIQDLFPDEHKSKPIKLGFPKSKDEIMLFSEIDTGEIKTIYYVTNDAIYKSKAFQYKGNVYLYIDFLQFDEKNEQEIESIERLVENNEIVTVALTKDRVGYLVDPIFAHDFKLRKTWEKKGIFRDYPQLCYADKQLVVNYFKRRYSNKKQQAIEWLNSKSQQQWTTAELDALEQEYRENAVESQRRCEMVDQDACLKYIMNELRNVGYKGKEARHIYNFVWSVVGARRARLSDEKEEEDQQRFHALIKMSGSNAELAHILHRFHGLSIEEIDLIYDWAVTNHQKIKAFIESQIRIV